MGVVALGSLRSAAVTTSALALCRMWPEERDVLLAEVDPAGGTLAATIGLHAEPGLQSLAAEARRGLAGDALGNHAQAIAEHAGVVLAPPIAEQARAALAMLGELARLVRLSSADVLCDCGRLDPASPALSLFNAADVALLVVRSELADFHVLAASLERRGIDPAQLGSRLGIVLVGSGPYRPDEIEEAVGIAVVASFPHDPAGVRAMTTASPRPFALRGALPRAARSFATVLADRLAAGDTEHESDSAAMSHAEPSDDAVELPAMDDPFEVPAR